MGVQNPQAFIPGFTASATADTTVTSAAAPLATPILMNSMTLTPIAGNYLINFSSSFDHSNQVTIIRVSIFVGGVQVTHTVRDVENTPNAVGAQSLTIPLSTHCISTVNGSQAIEVRWGTAAGTATAHQRTLTAVRIGP